MKKIGPIVAVVVVAQLLSAGAAWSQRGVWLRRVAGEIGVDFDGSWVDLTTAPGAGRQNFEEWIQVDLSGAVSDPRLVSFAIGLRPIRAQTNWTGEPVSPDGGRSAINGYAALNLLGGAPLSLSARGRIWRNDHRGRFGFETDETLTELAGRLLYRNRYMPATLEYSDRSRDVTWRPSPQQSNRRDETIRILSLVGRSSKTTARIEQLWYDDRLGARDFNTFRANLDHRLRWGKGSNLSSNFRYRNQAGSSAYDLITWTQSAHLQHTSSLSSDYNYSLFRQESPGNLTRGWTGKVQPFYEIVPGLVVSAEGYGHYRRFRAGRSSYYRAQPEARFIANLPLRSSLRGRVAIGYEWHDQEPGEDGLATVINERHVIEPSGRFFLDERFIDVNSVVVTSADEILIFELDFDYLLLEEDPFLEIVVLPGGRIEAGDTVLVDYRYHLMPAASANALVTHYDLELRQGGLRIFHRRLLQDDIDGVGPKALPLLRNIDDVTTGIGFSTRIPAGSFSILGQHRRRQSDTFDFTSYNLSARLSYALLRNLRATAGGQTALRRGGRSPLDLTSAEASLDWAAARSLRLGGELALWTLSEDGREETFVGGGVTAQWLIGLFTLSARYDRLHWENAFGRTEDRLLARIVRRF